MNKLHLGKKANSQPMWGGYQQPAAPATVGNRYAPKPTPVNTGFKEPPPGYYAAPESNPAAHQVFDNSWADTAADIAAGTNPFTGIPWYGYKAVRDFSNGNYSSGLGNVLWGAASLFGLGGAGAAAKGALKGTAAATKAIGAANKVKNVATIAPKSGLIGRVTKPITAPMNTAVNKIPGVTRLQNAPMSLRGRSASGAALATAGEAVSYVGKENQNANAGQRGVNEVQPVSFTGQQYFGSDDAKKYRGF